MAVKIPLYAFVEGDTMGLLVAADGDETVGELAERLAQAAAVRVAPALGDLVYLGRIIDPSSTVAEAGILPLDRVDVRRRR